MFFSNKVRVPSPVELRQSLGLPISAPLGVVGFRLAELPAEKRTAELRAAFRSELSEFLRRVSRDSLALAYFLLSYGRHPDQYRESTLAMLAVVSSQGRYLSIAIEATGKDGML